MNTLRLTLMIDGKSQKRAKASSAPVSATASSGAPEEILLSPDLQSIPTSELARLMAEFQRRMKESPAISESQLATTERTPAQRDTLSYSDFSLPAERDSPGAVESPLYASILPFCFTDIGGFQREPLELNFSKANIDPFLLISRTPNSLTPYDSHLDSPPPAMPPSKKKIGFFQNLFGFSNDRRGWLDFRVLFSAVCSDIQDFVRAAATHMGVDFSKPYAAQSTVVMSNIMRMVKQCCIN